MYVNSFAGWTDDALAKAMSEVGYDPLSHTMITNGPVELVYTYICIDIYTYIYLYIYVYVYIYIKM
jgi:ubiquinone biosynthesis protein COQ9